ncbi:hypothetical protein, partial [Citrobacter freundii]|uniref:hypothetical protein n=1 Tax=Citrobacter freundii TaxID=546 RepID=UPI001CA40337
AVCSLCPSPTMGFFLSFARHSTNLNAPTHYLPRQGPNNIAQNTVTLFKPKYPQQCYYYSTVFYEATK